MDKELLVKVAIATLGILSAYNALSVLLLEVRASKKTLTLGDIAANVILTITPGITVTVFALLFL